MRRCIFRDVLVLALAGSVLNSGEALSQSTKKPRPQGVTLRIDERELRRSVFSGNEVQLGIFWAVQANCDAAPLADVRVVEQPSNGDLSFREVRSVVELKKESRRAHCNGTPITGVGVFYKSREDFTGHEKMQIDVDYKVGLIRRYSLIVSVR
jgi:hypothetical protein